MTRRLTFLAVAVAMGFTTLARAQTGAPAPMEMIDPAQMSGIPRPDSQVQPGILMVRVLRGDFAHPLVGQEVVLESPNGVVKAKVDDTQRAVFSGLLPGQTYVAKSAAFGQTLTSQPITMPAGAGVKVMLVFPRDEKEHIGDPDGKVRSDERLAVGTLAVRVVDDNEKPLLKVTVALMSVSRAQAQAQGAAFDERRAETDGEGVARFVGLAPTQAVAYLVKALRSGAEVVSEPFQLPQDHGAMIGLRSQAVSRDLTALRLGQGSHVIVEVRDDMAQVVENLLLENTGSAPIDPGPAGLRLPLPDGASGAGLLSEERAGGVRLDGDAVVVSGRIAPGQTAVGVGFFLPLGDGRLRFRQTLPVALAQLLVVTERLHGMEVEGNQLQTHDRELRGRNMWVVTGPAVPAGGALYFQLTGLPMPSVWGRYLAATLAGAVALWALVMAFRPGARAAAMRPRAVLDKRRRELLEAAARLDDSLAAAKEARALHKLEHERAKLVDELEQIYRELDEAAA